MELLDPSSYGLVVTAFFFSRYVRRLLDTETRLPAWDNYLKRIWLVGLGLMIGSDILDTSLLKTLFAPILYLSIGYLAWLHYTHKPARTLLLAIVPLAISSLINKLTHLVAPTFYKTNEDYFESALGFAFFWLITFLVIAFQQKKALKNEQLEREQEAEQRRLIETKKNELEYLVAERTAEITRQKEALEQTLAELKNTQSQLVHSEKMASLGELTAGIAHEIQNPLNFVNNFSDVSIELLDELADEQTKADRDPELEAELLTDLKQNLQKISHHGGRAASIVKGMLQHSRSGSGQREPTDLNALCDEYLRLAYHGLRAKDKTFNASFTTNFDSSLGLISLVPQDMGRVLLNLFTNAFYAVQQRQKQAGAGYQPTVTVSTCCTNGEAVVKVIDNGIGMSDAVEQKIFQPFFTTKPTGEGTGLGLSLAFDIITKGHSGDLAVESQEGQGTTFTIHIPA